MRYRPTVQPCSLQTLGSKKIFVDRRESLCYCLAMTNEELVAKLCKFNFSEEYIESQIEKWLDEDGDKKQIQCASCEQKFTAYQNGRYPNRYCSRSCAQRAYRKRVKEQRATALSSL